MAEAKEIMEDQRGPVQEKDLDEMFLTWFIRLL